MTTQGGTGVVRPGGGAPIKPRSEPSDGTTGGAAQSPAPAPPDPAEPTSDPIPAARRRRSRTDGTSAVAALVTALRRLRDQLDAGRAAFPLALPGTTSARTTTRELADQLDDYLLPRLARLDAPLLVVVGGSTGAGKSTLVNSLVRASVSAAGVLRPTTRSPVLVASPADVPWFSEQHVLPGLARTTGAGAEGRAAALQLVPADALPPGLAFLDAPDIDSVESANRELAGQLLAAADLWLFVTTAARYADAVPWEVLRTARSRGTVLAMVLDRVPEGAEEEVVEHLREMLVAHRLGDAPLFVLPEVTLDNQGLLSEDDIAPIRDWFATLAADAERRTAVARQTVDGAVVALCDRVRVLAHHADAQRDAARSLREAVDWAYQDSTSTVDGALKDGTLLRGEVLARWQEFVGTGELLRTLQTRVGRLRDQLAAAFTGRQAPGRDLRVALESGVVSLVLSAATDAAEQTATRWRSHPAGAELLRGAALGTPAGDLRDRVERQIREWQGGVLDLVRTQAAGKRTAARFTAYTVNATGLVVMIAVFASTAFIPTGAEVAVAGGTAVVSQKVLEAIFGDQAVRDLATRARADLMDRVHGLLDTERRRFTGLLETAPSGADADAGDRLRTLAAEAAAARGRAKLGGPAALPPDPGAARDDAEPERSAP